MKRRRCTVCKHTMKGHKRRACVKKKKMELGPGVTYEGSVYDNIPCGRGRLKSTTSEYIGEFLNGQRHGFGIETFSDGRKYEGEWQMNKYNGNGHLTYADGKSKKGTFVDGRLHGYAVVQTSIATYEGFVAHGVFHGKGTYREPNGEYVGAFFYGVKHGEGTYSYSNGDTYSGQWRRGVRSGMGIFTSIDGIYTGNWSRDMRNGRGRWVSKDHGVYDGCWKRNMRHNQGAQTYSNGVTYVGGWHRGKKTGHGTQKWPNGDKYVGFWSNDEYNGRGCLRIGGCSYEGEWVHGKREGFFTETCGSYKCTGTWKNDVRHGIFENNDKTQQMYIWGVEVIYNSVREVKQATKRALSTGDYETASIIAEHYLNIISWAFLSTCDENGHLLYLVEPTQITQWLSKHSWNLFKKGRYKFISKMMKHCETDSMDHVCSSAPELFDQLTCDFVANPWIVHNISYSESTKQKLLAGLHLGEFGRCPPMNPFTRQTIDNSAGKYLSEMSSTHARSIYQKFMNAFKHQPDIEKIAFKYDLEDFETSIRNARESKDIDTLRRLLNERDAFIQHQGKYVS